MEKPQVKPIPPSPHLGDHQLGNSVGFIDGEHGLCCHLLQRGQHVDASVVDEAVQAFVSHNFFHFFHHFLDAALTDHICTEEQEEPSEQCRAQSVSWGSLGMFGQHTGENAQILQNFPCVI